MKPETKSRGEYRHFLPVTTRWADNDAYGHDTVVNQFPIVNGVLDSEHSPVIGLVVETHCNYFALVAFPDQRPYPKPCGAYCKTVHVGPIEQGAQQ